MSNEYNKPPLGTEPATIHAKARAKELADAISRNILDDNFHYCKMWAEELAIQIEIAQKFKPIEIRGLHKGGDDGMTREEAIEVLNGILILNYKEWWDDKCDEAVEMAIESLSADAVEVVRCKDCCYQEHCHETVAHTKNHDGFREHWSEPIEWCSRGERREE